MRILGSREQRVTDLLPTRPVSDKSFNGEVVRGDGISSIWDLGYGGLVLGLLDSSGFDRYQEVNTSVSIVVNVRDGDDNKLKAFPSTTQGADLEELNPRLRDLFGGRARATQSQIVMFVAEKCHALGNMDTIPVIEKKMLDRGAAMHCVGLAIPNSGIGRTWYNLTDLGNFLIEQGVLTNSTPEWIPKCRFIASGSADPLHQRGLDSLTAETNIQNKIRETLEAQRAAKNLGASIGSPRQWT